ncbi:MAG: hypothetical protein FJX68_08590 [Alphaproteobacteria bacterium]|nr:hypothetical protein [Alphaproteobacteria bacterium]
MDLAETLVALGFCCVLFGFATWRARRPYEPGRLPLLPMGLVQFVGLLGVVLMLAHLATLLTGTPFGR